MAKHRCTCSRSSGRPLGMSSSLALLFKKRRLRRFRRDGSLLVVLVLGCVQVLEFKRQRGEGRVWATTYGPNTALARPCGAAARCEQDCATAPRSWRGRNAPIRAATSGEIRSSRSWVVVHGGPEACGKWVRESPRLAAI